MSNPEEMLRIKQTLTLDFNQASGPNKRRTYDVRNISQQAAGYLSTPDMDKLAISTPDLDLLAKAFFADSKATNLTSDLPTYSRLQYNDSEQAFAEALVSMQNAPSAHPASSTLPLPPPPVSSHNSQLPQSSLPHALSTKPVNLENQEKLKLERKRLRNRIAATKCRQRKLERIQQLERRKNLLALQKEGLLDMIDKLDRMRNQCHEYCAHHVKMGCNPHDFIKSRG